MIKTETLRGFPLVRFFDAYGEKCSLQKSSLATSDCVWLGVDNVKPLVLASDAKHLGVETNETTGWVEYPIPDAVLLTTRMHLNRKQVAALLPHLQRFVDTGEI